MNKKAFFFRWVLCALLALIPYPYLKNQIFRAHLEIERILFPHQRSSVHIFAYSNPRKRLFFLKNMHAHLTSTPSFLRALKKISFFFFNSLSKQERALLSSMPVSFFASLKDHLKLFDPSDGIYRSFKISPALTQFLNTQVSFQHLSEKKPYWIKLFPYPLKTLFCHGLASCTTPSNSSPEVVLLFLSQKDLTSFLFPVPSALRPLPKITIFINALEHLFQKPILKKSSFLVNLFLAFFVTFLGGLFILYFSIFWSALAFLLTECFLVLLGGQYLFHIFSVLTPTVTLSMALLMTYLIFTSYKLALQEVIQWRSFKQNQVLKEMEELKSNFLTLLSHELKTPIARIQMTLQKFRKQLPLEKQKKMLDTMERNTHELKKHINSILNLAKIESNQVLLHKHPCDINEIISNCLKKLVPFAHEKNITIQTQLEPLFSIECDEDLIQQVILNLLDNAIRYTPNQKTIWIRSQEKGPFVQVEIEDSGPGIPQDKLPFMFRKFYRFSTQKKTTGSGLGLYLSKYFIEKHEGMIQLKTQKDQGTKVVFFLPIRANTV